MYSKCTVFRDGNDFDVSMMIDFVKTDDIDKCYFAFDRELKKFVFTLPKNFPKDRYILYTCRNADLMNGIEWYSLIYSLEQMQNATGEEVVSMEINRRFDIEGYARFASERNIIPLQMFENLEVNQNG